MVRLNQLEPCSLSRQQQRNEVVGASQSFRTLCLLAKYYSDYSQRRLFRSFLFCIPC